MSDDPITEETPAEPNKVFVGGLLPETTMEELTAHFSSISVNPESCTFFEDTKGQSKGCALAVFATPEEAQSAIETITGSSLGEKEIFARADRGPKRPRRRERVNEDKSYIFVGNLSLDVKEEDLTSVLSRYGEIINCSITRKRRNESSVGYANVQFSSEEEAAAALDMNGVDFEGRPLTLETLKRPPRTKKSQRESKAAEESEVNACVLYVGNLAWSAEEQDLQDLFSAHGTIIKTEIARDKRANKSRGWGTVEFSNVEEASAAIDALNKYTFQDREIEVEIRKGKKRESKKPSKKTRGRKQSTEKAVATDAAGETKPKRRRNRKKATKSNESGAEDEPKNTRRRPKRRNKKSEGEDEEPKPRRERKEPEPVVVSNPDCHLYVGNLAWEVTDDMLEQLFSTYGSVAKASVTMNRREDRSRGWGTVEMADEASAQDAVNKLHDSPYLERSLIVRFDKRVTSE